MSQTPPVQQALPAVPAAPVVPPNTGGATPNSPGFPMGAPNSTNGGIGTRPFGTLPGTVPNALPPNAVPPNAVPPNRAPGSP